MLNTISAVIFCLIQIFVRFTQHAAYAPMFYSGHANTDRAMKCLALKFELDVSEGLAEIIKYLHCRVQLNIRHKNAKFFTAKAGRNMLLEGVSD